MARRSIFSILLVFGSITGLSIWLFERNPELKYQIDQPKYQWIDEQIFHKAYDKDLNVFLGSSHTWYGVDTDLINKTRPDQLSLNFGVNWFGNDTRLILLRDLLAHQKPNRIFIEIGTRDSHGAHQLYPVM